MKIEVDLNGVLREIQKCVKSQVFRLEILLQNIVSYECLIGRGCAYFIGKLFRNNSFVILAQVFLPLTRVPDVILRMYLF